MTPLEEIRALVSAASTATAHDERVLFAGVARAKLSKLEAEIATAKLAVDALVAECARVAQG